MRNTLKQKNTTAKNYHEKIFVEIVKVPNPVSMAKYHYHTRYELYYLYSGERFYFVQDKTYHIKKGSLVLIPPNVIHATYNVENIAYERCLVTFLDDDIRDFSAFFSDINFYGAFENSIHVVDFSLKEQLIIESILENMSSTDDFSTKQFFLMQLLFLANKNQGAKPAENDNQLRGIQKTITEVVAHINNNFQTELNLDNISAEFFIDSCYLSRIFKKTVGMSFVDYINNVRIMEAKKLLTSTDESIISISENVGFKSNTHFGRVFKAITGISPLQYRKQKRDAE